MCKECRSRRIFRIWLYWHIFLNKTEQKAKSDTDDMSFCFKVKFSGMTIYDILMECSK